jgi:hypothetical protein
MANFIKLFCTIYAAISALPWVSIQTLSYYAKKLWNRPLGLYSQQFIFFAIYKLANKPELHYSRLEMLVRDKHSSLLDHFLRCAKIVVVNTMWSIVPCTGRLLALPSNVRIGWKCLRWPNTLAYYANIQVTIVKSLIAQNQSLMNNVFFWNVYLLYIKEKLSKINFF